jgi:chromosome segregation ATPase
MGGLALLRGLPWKWLGLAAVALGLCLWIWSMRATIDRQAAEIGDQQARIGALRGQLDQAVATADHNASLLHAAEAEAAAAMARISREQREAARRESRLKEALNEIDKWPEGANDAIGGGLRGVLGRLREDDDARAPPDH